MFEEAGVATKVEANGKIFPVSDKAAQVLDALVQAARALRCRASLLGASVVGNRSARNDSRPRFAVKLSAETVTARSVIVAVGGCRTRDAARQAMAMRSRDASAIRSLSPSPRLFRCASRRTGSRRLRGISLPDAVASVYCGASMLQSRREAVLFTHHGLSGPAILDVSRAAARHVEPSRSCFGSTCSRMSRVKIWTIASSEDARRGRRSIVSLVPEVVPAPACGVLDHGRRRFRRIGWGQTCLATSAGVWSPRVKELALPIAGTLGFEKAEVTSGGVALGEIEPKTLESRLVRGLYFAGEILDLDGLIGGYNFQAAWSTGWLAGETASVSSHGVVV